MASPKCTLVGVNAPKAIESFTDCNLHPKLLSNIVSVGYDKPTAVQCYSIPVGLAGRDIMASAQTGSGKTAAFLVPIIHRLLNLDLPAFNSVECCFPYALILAPTRELATQIHAESLKFVARTSILSKVVYGGQPRYGQLQAVRRGVHILIATPGRLKDYIDSREISLAKVKYLVLDEADRMLDMGFEKDIRYILESSSRQADRQTMLFSATFPPEIQRMAGDFMKDHLFLEVGIVGSATADITQSLKYISDSEKINECISQLEAVDGQAIVFTRTKRRATAISTALKKKGFNVDAIHSDRTQREREMTLKRFRNGAIRFLVGTDVIGRGMDVKGISQVINLDMPKDIDTYVHRIGRTGRAGTTGTAMSYFTQEDTSLAKGLVRLLKTSAQEIPEWLAGMATMPKQGGRQRGGFRGGAMRSGGGGGRSRTPYGRY